MNNSDSEEFERSQAKAKLLKKMPKDVAEELDSMDRDSLKRKIVSAEQALFENQQARKADVDLVQLKEQVKNASASYTDVKNSQTRIAQYAVIRLAELDG